MKNLGFIALAFLSSNLFANTIFHPEYVNTVVEKREFYIDANRLEMNSDGVLSGRVTIGGGSTATDDNGVKQGGEIGFVLIKSSVTNNLCLRATVTSAYNNVKSCYQGLNKTETYMENGRRYSRTIVAPKVCSVDRDRNRSNKTITMYFSSAQYKTIVTNEPLDSGKCVSL